ncbi:MAG: amidase [Pseudomonadota bacterium]
MSASNPTSTRRELLQITATGLAATILPSYSTANADDTLIDENAHMSQRPLHYQTLTDVATQIAKGELSSAQVTDAQLKRIQTLEPKLHSYYTVMAEQAMQASAAADAAQAQGKPLGPLHGVPIAVKDLCHKKGAPTTAGHVFRKNQISEADATVVARLEEAGAIILGKLATTEGAMVGYHRAFEIPRNPWGDLDRWPGVSSGGSGVATAAGLCFASLGSDTGGSIRYPSAANGIVGLKPTWGRVSRHGVLDLAPTLDHIGPMTRSIRDAARVLNVIAGHDPHDPTSLTAPVDDYEAEMTRGVVGLRLGWDENYATQNVEPHVASAVRNAVSQLASQGANIVEIDFPTLEEDEANAWSTLAAAEAAAVHEATFPARQAEYGNYFRQFLESGHQTSSVALAKAIFARKRANGRVAPVFDGIDCLICPTLASESFRYQPEDAYGGFDFENGLLAGVPLDFFGRSGRFVSIWDYNGYPTLSVPCGFSPDDIPLSLQLIGSPLSEAVLCRAGYAFEQANDFHLKHPLLA